MKTTNSHTRTTKGRVALEVNLPKFKDYKVGRLISLVYNKYDQRGRSLCYTKFKLTEINLSAKCGTNNMLALVRKFVCKLTLVAADFLNSILKTD